MIRDAYVMLSQEPWCYTPEQIGKLTDWQIRFLYAEPAAKRAKEFQEDFPTGNRPAVPKAESADLGEPGSPAHRNWHISAFVNGPMSMTPQQAAAAYEKQLSVWHATQNGKG